MTKPEWRNNPAARTSNRRAGCIRILNFVMRSAFDLGILSRFVPNSKFLEERFIGRLSACSGFPVSLRCDNRRLNAAIVRHKMSLLEIKNFKLEFGSGEAAVRAVDDISMSIESGETVCLVGESGCGKSVTALSIARLLLSPPARYVGGEILLNGRDVLKMSKAELREIRGGVISYVFQEPGASLNPVLCVGKQIKEMLDLHKPAKLGQANLARNVRGPTPSTSQEQSGARSAARLIERVWDDLIRGRLLSRSSNEEVIHLLKLVGIPAPESRI